jgi:hypothetical protein
MCETQRRKMEDSSDNPNHYYRESKPIRCTIYLLVLYYLLHNKKQGHCTITSACPHACIALVMASARTDFHYIQYECWTYTDNTLSDIWIQMFSPSQYIVTYISIARQRLG